MNTGGSGVYRGKTQSQGFDGCGKNKDTFTHKKESYDHVKVTKPVLPAQLLRERRRDQGIKPTPLKCILTEYILEKRFRSCKFVDSLTSYNNSKILIC